MRHGFQNNLHVSLKNNSDSVWILDQPLVYQSPVHGRLEVPAGFETDLASVPRIPVVYRLWGDRAHREAVLHDAAYCIDFPLGLSYTEANNLFLEAMESRGVPWYIRYPMYLGVCAGGWTAFKRRCVGDKL